MLENVDSIKCVGVTITKDLKWDSCTSKVCIKANRSLVIC